MPRRRLDVRRRIYTEATAKQPRQNTSGHSLLVITRTQYNQTKCYSASALSERWRAARETFLSVLLLQK